MMVFWINARWTAQTSTLWPRTEPWWTPNMKFTTSDKTEPIFMHLVRSVRYDLNQSRHLPLTPNHAFMQSSSYFSPGIRQMHLICFRPKCNFSWMTLSLDGLVFILYSTWWYVFVELRCDNPFNQFEDKTKTRHWLIALKVLLEPSAFS